MKTTIPFPVLVSEALTLYLWCQTDKEVLVNSGLNWTDVQNIPVLCKECEELYLDFTMKKRELTVSRKRLRSLFRDASRVRAGVANKLRYIMEVAGVSKRLPAYYRRRSYTEIIKDLLFLAQLAEELQTNYNKIDYDRDWILGIRKLAALHQEELIGLKTEIIGYNEKKEKFYSAYTELHRVMKYVRKTAFRTFPPGANRRQGYMSSYHRRKKDSVKETV